MNIAHRISHGTNVVVNSQSANSKNFLLLIDWMLTTTTFVPWDILWAMVMLDDSRASEVEVSFTSVFICFPTISHLTSHNSKDYHISDITKANLPLVCAFFLIITNILHYIRDTITYQIYMQGYTMT